MRNKYEVEDYYILYFDVLGYKNKIQNQKYDGELLILINNMLKSIIKRCKYSTKVIRTKIKIRVFSDNFLICIKETDISESDAYIVFNYLAATIQLWGLLVYKLLVRGSWTKGKFYIDKQLVYGAGLVRAVELENCAKYPRIIVDNKVFGLDKYMKLATNTITLDDDKKAYFNCFKKANKEELELARKSLIMEMIEFGELEHNQTFADYEIDKISEKLRWIVDKFNEECQSKNHYELIINYKNKE